MEDLLLEADDAAVWYERILAGGGRFRAPRVSVSEMLLACLFGAFVTPDEENPVWCSG
jgi:hypothetical protein